MPQSSRLKLTRLSLSPGTATLFLWWNTCEKTKDARWKWWRSENLLLQNSLERPTTSLTLMKIQGSICWERGGDRGLLACGFRLRTFKKRMGAEGSYVKIWLLSDFIVLGRTDLCH